MDWKVASFFIFLLFIDAIHSQNTTSGNEINNFQVINFNWHSVKFPLTIGFWLMTAALAKIIFNNLKLNTVLPDSSLLIAIGLLLGCVIKQTGSDLDISLDSHAFFLYLLPPIIFDAGREKKKKRKFVGYFMPNRALFENIGSILLFSVVGTIWNTFAIGGSLLFLQEYNFFTLEFSTFEIFVFSALISAVDPVAVIAVFEEIHVNEFLFVNVFGEALFNDGVTVVRTLRVRNILQVLYQMFKSFALIGYDNLETTDYVAGGLSFFVVAIGGMAIGTVFAFLTALATKYTHANSVKILAPVFIFVLPYMAYLTAEMVSLSSIIAIAVCGMIMKQYVKGNITVAATHSVKYFTKMLAQSGETVIFMFLGLSTLSSQHYWDSWFVAFTLIFCLIWRTVGVIIQCSFLNFFRHKKFSKVDQFVLSYGGLRGAIAFGLAVSIPASIAAKPMFVTTTIVVIYFTVFLQGVTIRPLVHYLKVETQEQRDPTMTESVYGKYLMYMMSGLEEIAGLRGHYSLRDRFERFNANFLRPVLMRHEERKEFDASTIVRAYNKITLEDALNISKKSRTEEPRLNIRPTKSQDIEPISSPAMNMDELYSVFSDMMDRKLREMKVISELEGTNDDGDIKDDYMKEMEHKEEEGSDLEETAEGIALKERKMSKASSRKKSVIRPISFAV